MDKKVVLFIEDSDSDFEMAKRALRTRNLTTSKKHDATVKVMRHKDGLESIEMLKEIKKKPLIVKQVPNIIFLDLDIPGCGGVEVLCQVRQCEILRLVPIIIFSGSASDKDILESYQNGANSYIKKSDNFDDWVYQFKALRNYWLEVVELPR